MPFLPFVLILAWQALSKSASFALGWATAIYFGQVPGRQGRVLSVISLVAAGWVIVVVGFGIPIFGGAALEAAGVIEENFDVEPLTYVGLVAGVVLTPPLIAAATVYAQFHDDRSLGTWLRMVPMSFPATVMLGASVLQMVAVTPVLLFQRWRQKRKLLQVPLVMRDGSDDDALVDAVRGALASIGLKDVAVAEATGPKSWPLRTVGFASRHLLGAVVRGEPVRLATGELEIFAYATNVSIQGPKEEAYRVRAAMERELAFRNLYLTWNEEAQGFEDDLYRMYESEKDDVEELRTELDEVQARIDVASLNLEEWNVLYRLRLQLEQEVARRASERSQ
ncbi:MAG TPA: hypothetical protein VEW95_03130 [Candidatus Limnocylindrales bacterium]|nr:hypothetical protein [Candidatus Limnocylindrales bacterium]